MNDYYSNTALMLSSLMPLDSALGFNQAYSGGF